MNLVLQSASQYRNGAESTKKEKQKIVESMAKTLIFCTLVAIMKFKFPSAKATGPQNSSNCTVFDDRGAATMKQLEKGP